MVIITKKKGSFIVEVKAKELANKLKVLANENRLLILYYLLEEILTKIEGRKAFNSKPKHQHCVSQ